ncbi:uncharacterized protein LOC116202809 isoform X2 [Punica granatum]|uniref:Uncharacterized protein LOC116202809 isoform X2 n=1 Tax=Punica granatum TaxID=22663 RepID=A0A6P8D1K9_PUNGR|nr:uncharacterized protein LOC116202809 isoform X2 [Punica granatum]
MGVLLGRRSRTSKIKKLSKLAISRIAILKRQREVRASHARSDVIELLNLGHQERALLRVEVMIKEQNMLDVFSMVEAYCHILVQKIGLTKKHKQIPDELREAFATLSFAASRCGELPELLELRRIIASNYSNEFTAHAVELPNNCGVNPKLMHASQIIQKLSQRLPDLGSRLMALKEIATQNGMSLQLENTNEEKAQEVGHQHEQPEPMVANEEMGSKHEICYIPIQEEAKEDEQKFQGSGSPKQKYRDVAGAAEEAFKSAAYAAEAARAAVTLSRSGSDGLDHHDDRGSSPPQTGNISDGELHRTGECTSVADQFVLDGKQNFVHRISRDWMQPISKIGTGDAYYGRKIKV